MFVQQFTTYSFRDTLLIEAEFLEPEIHSVMGLDSVEIKIENISRRALLIDRSKSKLKGKKVLKYIEWGEREDFPARSTIEGRIATGREWYDITTDRRSDVLWCKAHQYRHIAWLNLHKLIANCRMYDIFLLSEINEIVLCAILNSTIVALSKSFFGRYVGREGNLDTEVLDVKMMLVPDPHLSTKEVTRKFETALKSMSNRKAMQLVDVDSTDEENWTGELALEDRQQLDDAVLELLGINDADERRALRDELYTEITKLYRQIRVAEKKMQKHRSETARKGKQTAHSIADEIWEEFSDKPSFITPFDFIPSKIKTEPIIIPVGRAKIIKGHMFDPDGVQIADTFIPLGSPERSHFVKLLCDLELTGAVNVPSSSEACEKALNGYERERERLNEEFLSLASTYTADENMQTKVVNELWKKLRS